MDKRKDNMERDPRGSANRPGAPKGPRKAKQRRADLLESASRLFVEKGYASTTMNEIAADAGFAKGTLYHYFSTKAELLMSLREEFDQRIERLIRARVDRCRADDWRGRIRAWIAGAVDGYFALSDLHDVVIYGTEMPFRNSMLDSEVTRSLAALIADGVRAGAWKVEDCRWMAVMMFYCFRGGCDEAMTGTQQAGDIPDRLYPVFLRMLGIVD
ncbi:Fatty acid metabolism regulator protein [Pseudodesulfovibrio hydrargyri]|uniref:Fatty acid metabolism regulator protein n=1 Tax=Pseudodesulfovibrio hydrargyri TaxID=2125990 RepID=A0A1J5MWF6_9BACT|nr:TetR/AcrR family transcriptional regulator [Pseudodesulfovibrio hydrargyri]OIQ50862.1 Fatty acid metabolism regulator protein [Pseudodesulfovibrio hydrargyri]